MQKQSILMLVIVATAAGVTGHMIASEDAKPAAPSGNKGLDDTEAVKDVIAARQKYQNSLVTLYDKYFQLGDKDRARWVEEELKGFHLTPKPAYRIDLVDVFPDGMEPRDNDRKANEMFRMAMEYKGKGFGTDYLLNQRRAEIIFQDILRTFPKCDKLSDVAYELGDLYESKAYKQYARAALFFEKSCNWRKGARNDARLRAARIYDKLLNERAKAVEMYREVIANDTNSEHIKEAEKRLGELMSRR